MKVLVVGTGNIAYFLCRTVLSNGHSVTLIDQDREDCERIAGRIKATVLHGEGSDPAILEEAGARGADVVLAISAKDQDNLAVCQLARMQFEVPRAIALVNDPDNETVFGKLGVKAFASVRTIASMIEQRTGLDDVLNLIPAAEGKMNITEVKLPPSAPVAGMTLRAVALPPDCLVAVVMRNGDAVVPRGDTELRPGDRLVVITLPANHGAMLKALTGGTA